MDAPSATMQFDRVLEPLVEEATHGLESEHIYHAVSGVATASYEQKLADRKTTNELKFNIPISSQHTLLDACIYFEASFTATVDLTSVGGAVVPNLNDIDQYIPRSFPLNNMIENLTLSINTKSFQHTTSAFKPLHERMLPLSVKMDHMDGCPVFQENETCWATQFAEHNLEYPIHGGRAVTLTDPAGTVTERVVEADSIVLPKFWHGPHKTHRGYYEVIARAANVASPAGGTNLPTNKTTIRYTFREPLMHNLLEVTPGKRALYNLQNYIEVGMRLNSSIASSVFYSQNYEQSADITVAAAGEIAHSVPALDLDSVKLLYYTVAAKDQLPLSRIYPYQKFHRLASPVKALAVAGTTSHIFNHTFTGTTVPDMIAIYVTRERTFGANSQNQLDFTGARINRLSMRMQLGDPLFSTATPWQLYQMSLSNGLKVSWEEWYYGTKSIILVKPGKDFDATSGLNSRYTLQVTAEVELPKTKESNTYPAADATQGNNLDGNYELVIVQVTPCYLVFSNTTIEDREGFDSGEVVVALSKEPDHIMGDDADPERKMGGSFNFKRFFRKVYRGIKRNAPVVAHYANLVGQHTNNPMIQGAIKHINMANDTIQDFSGSALKLGGRAKSSRR